MGNQVAGIWSTSQAVWGSWARGSSRDLHGEGPGLQRDAVGRGDLVDHGLGVDPAGQRRRRDRGQDAGPIRSVGDVPMSVRAMKAGAVDFLLKPLEEKALLDAIQRAVERDRQQRRERDDTAAVRARAESLTPREREVFDLVVSGLLNKQVSPHSWASQSTR